MNATRTERQPGRPSAPLAIDLDQCDLCGRYVWPGQLEPWRSETRPDTGPVMLCTCCVHRLHSRIPN